MIGARSAPDRTNGGGRTKTETNGDTMPPQEAAAANVSAAHEVDDEDMVSSPRDAAHESQDLLFGASFMIHRRFVDNEWQSCGPKDEGHEPDSGVHRYDRVHGFAVSPDELALLGRNPEVAEAERRARTVAVDGNTICALSTASRNLENCAIGKGLVRISA